MGQLLVQHNRIHKSFAKSRDLATDKPEVKSKLLPELFRDGARYVFNPAQQGYAITTGRCTHTQD